MRSRPAGSPTAKTIGLAMWVVFAPAAIALLPGKLLWRGALPIEGVTGGCWPMRWCTILNLPGSGDCAGADGGAVAVPGDDVYVQHGAGVGERSRFGFLCSAVGVVDSQPASEREAGAGRRTGSVPTDTRGASAEQREEMAAKARDWRERLAERAAESSAESATLLAACLAGWATEEAGCEMPIA